MCSKMFYFEICITSSAVQFPTTLPIKTCKHAHNHYGYKSTIFSVPRKCQALNIDYS